MLCWFSAVIHGEIYCHRVRDAILRPLTETTTDHNAMQQQDIWMRSTVASFSQLEKLSVYGATVLFHLWILNIHIVDMNTESLQPSFESCWVVLAICPHRPPFFQHFKQINNIDVLTFLKTFREALTRLVTWRLQKCFAERLFFCN